MKWALKHQDLQIFYLKLNTNTLWVFFLNLAGKGLKVGKGLTLTAQGPILVVRIWRLQTTKVGPCPVRVNILIVAQTHNIESERASLDIYNDFKLKKPFGVHVFYKMYSAL